MNRKIFLTAFLLPLPVSVAASIFSADYTIPQLEEKIAALPESGRETTKAMLSTELGIALYRNGKYDEAIRILEEAAILGPRTRVARQLYRYLGKCYESSGRLDKAIDAYEMSAAYDPKNWKRHRDLGRLYLDAKLYRKAADSFERAIKLSPKKSSTYYLLGRTWEDLGYYHYAERELIKALDLGESSTVIFGELSYVFERMGRYQEAADSLKEALTEASSDADWCRMIFLSYLAGNEDRAKKTLGYLSDRDVPEETKRFYQALVELLQRSPSAIISGDVENSSLRGLLSVK